VTFDRLRTVLLFLTIASTAGLMPAQNDTWWQLRAGHDMWLARHVLLTDTFSHTVYGAFWPNHEWLSQILFYGLYAAGGMPLLTMASAAVVTGAWAIVWSQTPAPAYAKFLLTTLVIISACTTWSPRPGVLSLLLLAATLALLRQRRYGWLPVVFWLWANLHGAVVMGVVLLVAALAAALVERPESARRLAAFTALSLLATVCTPLGLHFWTDIAQSLARIRQLHIDEWAPPRIDSVASLPFALAAAALVWLTATRGRDLLRDPEARRNGHITLCACALALLPLALTAVRNVPPFVMLAVPALGVLGPFTSARARPAVARPHVNRAIAGVAAIASVITLTLAYANGVDHLHWTPLPAASLASLDTCDGNLYNRYDEGGYLIWFAPGRKVFLDGRQDPYPPSLIQEQIRVERTGDFTGLFRRYAIHCAYVPADSIVASTLQRAGWTPVYRDARWAVLSN
jgi:hypothetical protein